MLVWLQANAGSIAVILVILLIVFLCIRSLVRDKKAGKSACGNRCAHCQMAGQCHARQKK